jgi:putative ABC transport system ATP-binding protein
MRVTIQHVVKLSEMAIADLSVAVGAMAWISPDLTVVLMCVAPIIGTVAFLYTRAIRRISQRLQKNLGTLTKIAEERLGNVKTSQAFTGEIQEVHRYNHQIRRIFSIGRQEALWNASFFSSTSWMGNMSILVSK